MAKKVSKSSPVLAGALRLVVRIFAVLPLAWSRRLGVGIGYLLWLVPNRFRATSIVNVDGCLPEMSRRQRRLLVKESLLSTGQNVAEAGALWHWPAARLRDLETIAENDEVLQAGLQRGQGVLLLVPHVGNWEFFAHYLGEKQEFLSLYRPPRIAELDDYIRHCRERRGAEMAPASITGLRRIAKALRQGRVVVILPDQEPLKSHGVFAPFFGTPALTMTLVGSLVRRYGATAIFAFAQRTSEGKFQIRFLPAPEGLDDPDPALAAAKLNEGVERCVRLCPEQYMWSYSRFRTRPREELARRREGVGP